MTEQFNTLKEALSTGIVLFTYVKVSDNSTRLAMGTNNKEIITKFVGEKEKKPSDRFVRVSANLHYFDLGKMAPRQFRRENLRDIIAVSLPFQTACKMALALAYSSSNLDDWHIVLEKIYKINNGLLLESGEDLKYSISASAENVSQVKDFFEKTRDKDYQDCYHASFNDVNADWCMRHNGGRGLNGVMLAAGNIVSSGYDCFGTPIRHNVPSPKVEPTSRGLVEGIHFDVINDGEEVGIRETPKAEPQPKKAEPIVTRAQVIKERIDTCKYSEEFLKTYRLDLIKSLLSGKFHDEERGQDILVNAAFEMADKVIARLRTEF